MPETLPAETEITQQDLPWSSAPVSPSLLSPTTAPASSSTVGLITPEIIRPYPRVDRNALKKSKKGKLPGKSRIYTDTPEKNRLEEIEKAKQLKKQEQERKQRAKEMKRALHLLSDTRTKTKRQKKTSGTTKPKRQNKTVKTDSQDETDREDEANMSLRESSCSLIEETSEGSDTDNETPVTSENIKEERFVIVEFKKTKTV